MVPIRVITIGRGTVNDVVVNDPYVSYSHLQLIKYDDGSIWSVDQQSTNGTFVNGNRIQGGVPLRIGDQLQIGNTIIPWWDIMASQPAQVLHATSAATSLPESPSNSPKGKWPWWGYLIIGLTLLLLAGGGITWKVLHDKHKAKEQSEIEQRRALDEEQQMMSDAATQARLEHARAKAKVAETNSEMNRQEAESLRIIVTQKEQDLSEAKKKAAKLLDDNKKTEDAYSIQTKELRDSLKARENTEKRLKKQTQELRDSLKARKDAEQQLRDDLLLERQLTHDFYSKLNNANESALKKMCKHWNKSPENKYEFMVDKFENAKDNDTRKRIINVVDRALAKDSSPADTNKKG